MLRYGILIILAPSFLPHDEAVTTSCLRSEELTPSCPADISNSIIVPESVRRVHDRNEKGLHMIIVIADAEEDDLTSTSWREIERTLWPSKMARV